MPLYALGKMRWIGARPLDVGIVTSLVVLTTSAGVSYGAWAEVSDAVTQRDTLGARLLAETALLSLLEGAESGQRGYLITGKDRYLRPYEAAVSKVPRQLREFGDLMGEAPEAQRQFGAIEILVHDKLAELDATLRLRRVGEAGAALTLVQSDVGQATMEALRTVLGDLRAADEAALQVQFVSLWAAWRTSELGLATANSMALGGMALSLFLSRRDRRQRARAERASAEAAAQFHVAGRAKADFLANMSHEIRTPLNAVIGVSDLLLDTPLDARQQDLVRLGLEAGGTLLQLVNQILDLSKIEADKLELEAIPFSLAPVVETQAELVAPRAAQKHIALSCFVDPAVSGTYVGDPVRLGQVVLNLLSNAIKFTPDGGIVGVSVRVEPAVAASNWVRFEVSDTGEGLSETVRARLFKAFVQADSSTSRRYGGTGLGLAIAKRLVDLMRGQIGVESVPGAGATFWFRVPLTPNPGTTGPFGPGDDAAALVGVRALIVDPDPAASGHLATYLQAWGMRTERAATGAEACQRATAAAGQREPFRAIFIECKLRDGLAPDLAKKLRRLSPPLATPPVFILMSTFEGAAAESELSALGFATHLTKPLRQTRVRASLSPLSPAAEPDASVAPPTLAVPRARGRILVAEDSEVNQLIVLKQLEKLGYTARAVCNGVEVLRALQEAPYDLVLMDCQMPEMDGYETTRRIRVGEVAGRIPIVALTANAMREDEARCFEAGMDSFLSKPIRHETLRAELERWFRGGREGVG
ncbi:MAG TPA: response regulator [Myxococcota bacterium]|nr:response regulator [Myxococcota bacterium]